MPGEEVGLKKDLPIGDGNGVGGDVAGGAPFASDDGQRGQGSVSTFFVQTSRAFQESECSKRRLPTSPEGLFKIREFADRRPSWEGRRTRSERPCRFP